MTEPSSSPQGTPARLVSLDAFRGFDIAMMFFVNLSANRAAFPEWFGHAGWNSGRHGQWLADYVFPWFLFIMGVAIPFSMNSGRGTSQSTAKKLAVALRRGVIIYLLGILIWAAKSSPDGSVWRDGALALKVGVPISWNTFLHWDILPLIGLGYTLAVAAYLLPMWARIVVVVALLAGKQIALPSLSGTVDLERAAWVAARTDLDRAIRDWGWVGTLITQGLPATTTVIIGTLAGDFLRRPNVSGAVKAWGLIGAGLLVTGIAAGWAHFAPISKDFFTPSYVLVSCGTGAFVLGLFYAVLDAWRWPRAFARAVGAILLAAGAIVAWAAGPTWFTPGQANATGFVLAAGALLLGGGAAWDLLRNHQEPSRGGWLAAMGCNAIALYVLAELSWTLVWMRWRVDCPGEVGPQVAFAALQVHFQYLTGFILGESLAKGVGPWLATLTYIAVFAALAVWMLRRKVFIKV